MESDSFFVGNNILVALLGFDSLTQIVSENASISNCAEETSHLMIDSNLKTQMMIMAGLYTLIREMWKILTVRRTKCGLAVN